MYQKLYRPVGVKELQLILDTGGKAFPLRLDWQPIFYPVTNFDYAAEIAKKWNTKDEASDYAGFVTVFELPQDYTQTFELQNVGGTHHHEYWVPSEQLEEFNAQFKDGIWILADYYGQQYNSTIHKTAGFKDRLRVL